MGWINTKKLYIHIRSLNVDNWEEWRILKRGHRNCEGNGTGAYLKDNRDV